RVLGDPDVEATMLGPMCRSLPPMRTLVPSCSASSEFGTNRDRLRDGGGVVAASAGVGIVVDRRRRGTMAPAPVAALDEERQPEDTEHQPEKNYALSS